MRKMATGQLSFEFLSREELIEKAVEITDSANTATNTRTMRASELHSFLYIGNRL